MLMGYLPALTPLELLHLTLVFLRRRARLERPRFLRFAVFGSSMESPFG